MQKYQPNLEDCNNGDTTMLSGRLLPIHFPPAPDELLSSWYVRLAHANRLKAETFCTVLWGRQHQIWNRDIDRLSPEWLVRDLALRTGITFETAWTTTLKSYEGKIFAELRPTGISAWILPVKMYHRKHKWPGLQFCPECLKEDEEPYFRKRWRLALYTACNRHGVMLCDHCSKCGEPVMFHRRELGKGDHLDIQPLSLCCNCDYDLRLTKAQNLMPYENSASDLALATTVWQESTIPSERDVGFYSVLHQVCKLLVSEKWGRNLLSFAKGQLGLDFDIDPIGDSDSVKRSFFEHRTIAERHHILHLAYWLLAKPEIRLKKILDSKIVRINRLYKDLPLMPNWYHKIIQELPHRDIPKFRL